MSTSANVIEYSITRNGKEIGYYRQNILCTSHYEELLKFQPLSEHEIKPRGYDEEEAEWEDNTHNLEKYLRKMIPMNKEIREYFKTLDEKMEIPKNIYKQIFNEWGEESQLNMMTEEVGELLQAMSKYRRAKTIKEKRDSRIHLCEEIADVENMINQFRYIFDSKLIDKFKKEKLIRTLKLLKNNGNNN